MPNKILYVHGVTAFGGAERDLVSIIRELDRERFTPLVACSDQGPLLRELAQQGIQTAIIPLPPWRKTKSLLSRLPSVSQLYRLLVKEHIQLVHINDMWWVPQGYWASRLAKVPCVAHIRQELEPRRIRQYRLRDLRILLAVSGRVKQQLEHGGVEPERIKVLYSGLTVSQRDRCVSGEAIRERYGIQPDQPVIGTVAHLFPRKGYEYLLTALVKVRETIPSVKCLIVGHGDQEYTAQLQGLMRNLDLDETVLFVGNQADVWPYIEVMDIMVLPSIMEGFGIALLEAMALGKPVVATHVGGIPEVVEDGVTGRLVAPRDSASLALEILSLLGDPEKRQQMGQAGITRVKEMFTTKQFGHQLMEIYDELLEQPS